MSSKTVYVEHLGLSYEIRPGPPGNSRISSEMCAAFMAKLRAGQTKFVRLDPNRPRRRVDMYTGKIIVQEKKDVADSKVTCKNAVENDRTLEPMLAVKPVVVAQHGVTPDDHLYLSANDEFADLGNVIQSRYADGTGVTTETPLGCIDIGADGFSVPSFRTSYNSAIEFSDTVCKFVDAQPFVLETFETPYHDSADELRNNGFSKGTQILNYLHRLDPMPPNTCTLHLAEAPGGMHYACRSRFVHGLHTAVSPHIDTYDSKYFRANGMFLDHYDMRDYSGSSVILTNYLMTMSRKPPKYDMVWSDAHIESAPPDELLKLATFPFRYVSDHPDLFSSRPLFVIKVTCDTLLSLMPRLRLVYDDDFILEVFKPTSSSINTAEVYLLLRSKYQLLRDFTSASWTRSFADIVGKVNFINAYRLAAYVTGNQRLCYAPQGTRPSYPMFNVDVPVCAKPDFCYPDNFQPSIRVSQLVDFIDYPPLGVNAIRLSDMLKSVEWHDSALKAAAVLRSGECLELFYEKKKAYYVKIDKNGQFPYVKFRCGLDCGFDPDKAPEYESCPVCNSSKPDCTPLMDLNYFSYFHMYFVADKVSLALAYLISKVRVSSGIKLRYYPKSPKLNAGFSNRYLRIFGVFPQLTDYVGKMGRKPPNLIGKSKFAANAFVFEYGKAYSFVPSYWRRDRYYEDHPPTDPSFVAVEWNGKFKFDFDTFVSVAAPNDSDIDWIRSKFVKYADRIRPWFEGPNSVGFCVDGNKFVKVFDYTCYYNGKKYSSNKYADLVAELLLVVEPSIVTDPELEYLADDDDIMMNLDF